MKYSEIVSREIFLPYREEYFNKTFYKTKCFVMMEVGDFDSKVYDDII